MKSYIFLDRICFFAHHGVGEQETLAGNEFTVSLRLQVNIAPAIQTDDVADTVSYADVYELSKRNPPMGADIEAAGIEICISREATAIAT